MKNIFGHEIDYDREIERHYHPENFEPTFDEEDEVEECPRCHEIEYRPEYIGNDRDGWHRTGTWECDACDYEDKEVSDEPT